MQRYCPNNCMQLNPLEAKAPGNIVITTWQKTAITKGFNSAKALCIGDLATTLSYRQFLLNGASLLKADLV